MVIKLVANGINIGVPVEKDAQSQLLKAATLPIVHHHVAVMPDVHVGIGATVGSVIPTLGAIIPAGMGKNNKNTRRRR